MNATSSRIGRLAVLGWFVTYAGLTGAYLAQFGPPTFGDSHLYFRATAAWLDGGDPWAASYDGTLFAAPPPALLLSLPLIPFGEDVAVATWAIAGLAGVWWLVGMLGLPRWWILFPPLIEGWTGGSPDIALAALAAGGLAWVAVLTKPYAGPAVLGERGWRPVLIAGVALVVTVPVLPWGQFLHQLPAILAVVDVQTDPRSAWGQPVAMLLTGVALLSLGWRLGLGLATPSLWPNPQLHYAAFSMYAASRSPVLAIGLSLPVNGAAPISVVAFAGWTIWKGRTR